MQQNDNKLSKRATLLLTGLVSTAILLSACGSNRPTDIGVTNGKLLPCPESPNCVSSRSNNQIHAIKAIHFKKPINQAEAIIAVKEALLSLPKIEIITETETYLYAEATSKIMRFVDDVEFLFPNEGMIKEVHVRSASRSGYRDFNVNRERIESVRAQLIEKGLAVRE
tara:strand:- start:5129 stop:5632 length:504 start_codon:yes stop_codon:yes gene_type:complete